MTNNLPLLMNKIILQIEQQQDPLIDYGAEHFIYFGVFLVVVTTAIIIGMISKKIEHAIAFSLVLSVLFMVFLWNL